MTPDFLGRLHKLLPCGYGDDGFRLRVPLLFLSRMKFQVESLGQVESPFVECQLMNLAPKIKYVARGSTRRMEALVDVLAQVHREGAPSISFCAMDGAGTSTLGASTPQAVEVP